MFSNSHPPQHQRKILGAPMQQGIQNLQTAKKHGNLFK